MANVDISFSKKKCFNYSNETIVRFLSNRNFYFVPINEYDLERFYCMVVCEERSDDFLPKPLKNRKKKYHDFPLSIITCEECTNEKPTLLVFTKEEVERIISDNPGSVVSAKCVGVSVNSCENEYTKSPEGIKKELLTD